MFLRQNGRSAVSPIFLACLWVCVTATSWAEIPLMINHQGLVKVNGLPFTGNGSFRFGFLDGDTGVWLWTNDGTHVGQFAVSTNPDTAVTLPCNNGIYNVRLGDPAFGNMTAIPSTVFNIARVLLRVSFNDGANGWQLLSPDQAVTSSAYAYHAATADNAANALLLEGLSATQLGVPSGSAIIGLTPTAPTGYTYTGINFGDVWTLRSNMPTARAYVAAASVNGIVYAIGGLTGALNANEAYDLTTNTWSAMASMPTGRASLCAVAVNGIIYALGGWDAGGTRVATNEAYDPVANTWSTKASMSVPRGQFAAEVVDDIIYVFGGYNSSSGYLNSTEAYNPATNTWSTKAPAPTTRSSQAAAVVNGIIYVVGGETSGGTQFATNEAYDPSSNTWSTKASMAIPRGMLVAAEINGHVFAIGGATGPGSATNVVEAYDPVANLWSARSPLSSGRFGMGLAIANGDKVCLVGGNPTASTTEVYTPPLYVFVKD